MATKAGMKQRVMTERGMNSFGESLIQNLFASFAVKKGLTAKDAKRLRKVQFHAVCNIEILLFLSNASIRVRIPR